MKIGHLQYKSDFGIDWPHLTKAAKTYTYSYDLNFSEYFSFTMILQEIHHLFICRAGLL